MNLGSIAYINSLPVDWGLVSGAVRADFDVLSDVPSRLNERILSGEIAAGPVSAIWYAQNEKHFYVLPDLSISSRSGVQSVLLFSRLPMPALAGQKISVTTEGRSTPALLEILCRRRYGFRPQLVSGCDGAQARLLIGDRALQEAEAAREQGWVVTDLAEEWRAWTGLGFVFALWVVRRDAADADPERVAAIWRAIQASRLWGIAHRGEILRQARLRTGLSEKRIEDYFQALSYSFGKDLQKGFETYTHHAAECDLIDRPVKPVFFETAKAVAA